MTSSWPRSRCPLEPRPNPGLLGRGPRRPPTPPLECWQLGSQRIMLNPAWVRFLRVWGWEGTEEGAHLLQLPLSVLDGQGGGPRLVLAHQLEQVQRCHPAAAQNKGLLRCCVLDLNPLGFLKDTPPPSRSGLEPAEEGWSLSASLQGCMRASRGGKQARGSGSAGPGPRCPKALSDACTCPLAPLPVRGKHQSF